MSDLTAFGDAEPEDSWHPDDPTHLLVLNLVRRMALLDGLGDSGTGSEHDTLDRISVRLAAVLRRRAELTEREETRAEQIAEDLGFVRDRLDAGDG